MAMGFESGIGSYVHAMARVNMYFPVDHKGNAYCCCEQCDFYRTNSRSCALTNSPCTFPSKYVGGECPLMPVDDGQADRVEKLFAEISEENARYPSLDTE